MQTYRIPSKKTTHADYFDNKMAKILNNRQKTMVFDNNSIEKSVNFHFYY